MDQLIKKWKQGKETLSPEGSANLLVTQANSRKKQVRLEIYGNLIILALSLIILAWFFKFVISLKDTASQAGMYLMLGGLLVRVVIEIISVVKFRHIRYSDHIEQTTAAALSFYQFRRRVHGPVTVSILTMYVIGFYLLTPEFSQHIPLQWMIMMHVSFVIMAAVLFWLISKGVRKEMSTLKYLANLRQAITTANEGKDM
jgi:hypothetical protein